MNVTTLAISILATWRITNLLVAEGGPGDVLARFRDRIGVAYDESSRPYGRNLFAQAFTCIWCLSIWIGWVIALLTYPQRWVLHGLAYSAGAIAIDKALRL